MITTAKDNCHTFRQVELGLKKRRNEIHNQAPCCKSMIHPDNWDDAYYISGRFSAASHEASKRLSDRTLVVIVHPELSTSRHVELVNWLASRMEW